MHVHIPKEGFRCLRGFRGVYDLQEITYGVQGQALDHWVQLQGIGLVLGEQPNIRNMTPEALSRVEQVAAEAYSYTSTLGSLVAQLEKAYDQALAGRN